MSVLNDISQNLQIGKAKIVKELVQQAIDAGIPAKDILEEGLMAGITVVGEKFKNYELFVPDVLIAARAMNQGVNVLKPHLASGGMETKGKICIGTVQGDMHDIGKNLVKVMMEGKGIDVVDLGVDVPPQQFINVAIEENCDIICLSALLTTTMDVMEDVIKASIEAGIRDKVKIMVGGAPVNAQFAEKIGADAYTPDAASAAEKAAELLA